MKIHVYHGPNLNCLGQRSSQHYGNEGLDGINKKLEELAAELGVELVCKQTNREGQLVDWIQSTEKEGLVLNAAGYTHTSVAILDAVKLVDYPVVEVHLSNLEAREEFRRNSRIGPACLGQISGFGGNSYLLGLRAVVDHLRD